MDSPANRTAVSEPEQPRSAVPGGSATAPSAGYLAQWKLLLFVIFNVFVVNAALLMFTHYNMPGVPAGTVPSTFYPTFLFFKGFQWNDSLGTMLPAIHLLEQDPHAPVYQIIFFTHHTKFQYPLASLLPYYFLQRHGVSDYRLSRLTLRFDELSVFLTIAITILIGLKYLPRHQKTRWNTLEAGIAVVAIGLAGLFFCPLLGAADLGQIQTVLTFGFTLALYCWLSGKEAAAGAIVGLMMLVKPQYGLFLLWALLRKKYSAAIAGFTCGLVGLAASCLAFGFRNNLDYIQVLRFMSRRGEVYFANQSANGLFNRLLNNGNSLNLDVASFAPYNALVFWATMASSLALVALALFFPWGPKRRGGPADFACIILVSTMASPIAWNHHYAILLPILVWLWFGDYAWSNTLWGKIAIAVAYIFSSNIFAPLLALAATPIWNFLESYLYFAAILTLFLLMKSRHAVSMPV